MQLGKTQPLRIVKKVDFGVYLAEEEDQENRVLLPVKSGAGGLRRREMNWRYFFIKIPKTVSLPPQRNLILRLERWQG